MLLVEENVPGDRSPRSRVYAYAGTYMFPLAFNGLTSLIQKWLVAGVRIQIDLKSSNDFYEIIKGEVFTTKSSTQKLAHQDSERSLCGGWDNSVAK